MTSHDVFHSAWHGRIERGSLSMSVCKIDAGAERFRIEMADIRGFFLSRKVKCATLPFPFVADNSQETLIVEGIFSYANESKKKLQKV